MHEHTRGRLAVLGAAALFSTGGAAIKATSLTSWQVASYRSGIAALALIALLPAARRGWSVRLVPSESAAQAPVERVTGNRCSAGAVAALSAPGGGNLAAVRCTGDDGSCEVPTSLPLANDTAQQVLVLATRDDGSVDWSAAFGPLAEVAGAALAGRAYDLSADGRDWLYLTFVTDGTLRSAGISDFGCEPLIDGAGAGRWLVALQPQGFGGEAICAWAQRFGP